MRALAALALFWLQAVDYNADGLKALDEGKYDAAVQAFTKAVAADPKDYFAHFNLGLAYGFLHRDAEGVAEYRQALELKAGLYEAQLNAGILLMRLKNPAEAAGLFEAASEQKPGEFQPAYYLALAQFQSGSLDAAEASYSRALEINPKSASSELGLAHTLAALGRLPDADPHFHKAAELDPQLRGGLLELAGLYEKNGQPATAAAVYRELPDNPAAQQRLGELMLQNRQYADAVPKLEAAYAKEPDADNRAALAAAYVFAGQAEKALPLLEKSVAAEPANYDLRMMYAHVLRDRKQYSAASSQFLEAARAKPGDPKPWSELGGMLYMQGALQQSLGAYDKARELGENTPGNWFLRAIILDKLKQYKPALEAYQKFLSLSQGNKDQEFQARQRVRIIQRELEKR